MVVSSLSDLYFYLVGLFSYNLMWGIIVDTGLIYIPFILMFLNITIKSLESARDASDTAAGIKSAEVKVFLLLTALAVAILPTRQVDIQNVAQYQRLCEQDGTSDHVSNGAGNKANDLMVSLNSQNLHIPLLLEMVLSLSNGATADAINKIPCSLDISTVSKELMNAEIQSQQTKIETKQFLDQCYFKAKNRGVRKFDNNLPWITGDTDEYAWPGTPYFMTPEYYQNVANGFYAQQPIKGFASSLNNQNIPAYKNNESAMQSAGYGFPTCQEWWYGSTPQNGIRGKLLAELKEFENRVGDQRLQRIFEMLANNNQSTEDLVDQKIKVAYFNPSSIDKIQNAEMTDYGLKESGVGGSIGEGVLRTMGSIGVMAAAIPEFAGASMIKLAAPMAKGVVIFVVLFAMPFAFFVSQYSWKFVFTIHLFLASVIMWPIGWELAILIEDTYVSVTLKEGGFGIDDLAANPNLFMLSKFMTDGLFLVIPVLLSTIYSMAGLAGGDLLIGGANKMSGKGGSLGQSGASKVQNGVKNTASSAIKAKTGG